MIEYIIIKRPEFTGKIQTRKVSSKAEELAEEVTRTGEPSMRVAHGGTFVERYEWRAETECLLELALPPNGSEKTYVVQFYSQIQANKVTLAGAAHACFGSEVARIVWDKRFSEERKKMARRSLIEETYAIIAKEILL